MKKIFTAILLLAMLSAVNAQNSSSRFSASVSYSPNFDSHISSGEQDSTIFIGEKTGKFGSTASALFNISINPKLELHTGLAFTNRGYSVRDEYYYIMCMILPDIWFPANKTKWEYRRYDLDIPIGVKYRLWEGSPRLYVSGGLSVNIKVASMDRMVYTYEWGDQIHTYNNGGITELWSRVNLSAYSGFGLEMDITPAFKFFTEPRFEINLLPLDKETEMRKRLYSIGLATGFRFG